MRIPLVLALWEHKNFLGHKRTFVDAIPDLNVYNFNDKTSAVGVHPGPSWDVFHDGLALQLTPTGPIMMYFPGARNPTVSLFEHVNFGGRELVLEPGVYADLSIIPGWDANDAISSVRFNLRDDRAPGVYAGGGFTEFRSALGPAATIDPIPLVVTLDCSHQEQRGPLGPNIGVLGPRVVLVESSTDVGVDFGGEYNDAVVSVSVVKGPNYGGKDVVKLHRDANFKGGAVSVQPTGGAFISLSPMNFASVLSSVEIAACDC